MVLSNFPYSLFLVELVSKHQRREGHLKRHREHGWSDRPRRLAFGQGGFLTLK